MSAIRPSELTRNKYNDWNKTVIQDGIHPGNLQLKSKAI